TVWQLSVERRGNRPAIIKADTIEQLVSELGLSSDAIDELERYNRFCEAGVDEDFHKRSEYLVGVTKAPFYEKKVDSFTVLTVIGGLRTNQDMQVCDAADTPIPGLYNIGTMIGDVFAHTYTFQIPGHHLGMNCITFGYLTGKYIAENE
ncbi:FAD-binding protein, partial [Eggerthella lenta]